MDVDELQSVFDCYAAPNAAGESIITESVVERRLDEFSVGLPTPSPVLPLPSSTLPSSSLPPLQVQQQCRTSTNSHRARGGVVE
jgi:hypothetical protein